MERKDKAISEIAPPILSLAALKIDIQLGNKC